MERTILYLDQVDSTNTWVKQNFAFPTGTRYGPRARPPAGAGWGAAGRICRDAVCSTPR